MYSFFIGVFIFLVLVCVLLRMRSNESLRVNSPLATSDFKAFQLNYLLVYYIVMGADWLQGPYVYALYEEYGFEREDIAFLFIGGFLSSMVFGTVVGSLADKYGRKFSSVLFGVLYSISCLTKLINNFGVLFFGRILSGISTSLLFSAFDSWMIAEHNSKGFSTELLSNTFALATFGNGVVAIAAGIVASLVADSFGFVAPFMVSLLFLVASIVVISSTWKENYGNSTIEIKETFWNAVNDLKQDIKIPVLGTIQSLFEAAMYTFVFMWTPALQAGLDESIVLPFGLIFACYMVAVMIGSSIFSWMMNNNYSLFHIANYLLIGSAIALFLPVLTPNVYVLTFAFMVFEICCGLYFPCMGTLKAKFIPEQTRATIMNFFRVPLNFLVVVLLVKVGGLSNELVFSMCCVWLTIAVFLLGYFVKRVAADQGTIISVDSLPVTSH